ncbi:radical SAM protein [Vibrio metschnikovii]|nr:radical SAM protein [Vibrio metschnikovii]
MDYQLTLDEQNAHANIFALTENDILPDLVTLEKQLGEKKIQQLTLEFNAQLTPPLERLARAGFQPGKHPNHFVKPIHYQRSVRFSITEKCNYACFFCHEEGMEMGKKRAKVEQEQLFRVLDQFAEMDYQDFTFTGGEPLLSTKKVFACLDYMQQIGYLPEITFVSNGLAINDRLIERLKAYPGHVRFNISMHSLEEGAYNRIVQDIQKPEAPLKHNQHQKVKNNLLKLQAAGIPFKLNFVLLKGLNTSDEAIQAVLDYALQIGATRIKFLELLLTKELNHLYDYFYRLDALKDRLNDKLTLVEQTFKRDVYRYADTPLELEFQHCICARGCNTCPVNRGASFTAELKFFPCFLKPQDDFDLTQIPLAQAVEEGDQKILQMAEYYGDDSPIIIGNHYLTCEESFYYYQATSTVVDAVTEALNLEDTLERRRDFSEIYLVSPGKVGDDYSNIFKLVRNSYDQHALQIEQAHTVSLEKPGFITTHFSGDLQTITDPDTYLQQLSAQGYQRRLQLEWSISFYRIRGKTGDSGSAVSVSYNSNSGLYFIRSEHPLDQPGLKPVTESLPSYISKRLRLV